MEHEGLIIGSKSRGGGKEVVIVYDDNLDFKRNGSHNRHLHVWISTGLYEIPLILFWMVVNGGAAGASGIIAC